MFNALGTSWSDISLNANSFTNIPPHETLFDLSDLQGKMEGK
jgi:hypothetical protein